MERRGASGPPTGFSAVVWERKKSAFYFEVLVVVWECNECMNGILGLQGQGLEGGMLMATSPPLVGGFRTLRGRFVVWVWLGCKRWFSMVGFRGGAVRGTGKAVEVPEYWRVAVYNSVALLTVGAHRNCRVIGVGRSIGGFVGGQGRGNGVQVGIVGQRSGGSGGFIGQGGVGSAMGGVRWFGPTGRDQTYVPQGEPTFQRSGGAQGRGRNVGVLGAGVGRVQFEEGVQGGGVGTAGSEGVEEPLLPGRVLSQREQALGALNALIQVLGPEMRASS